MSLLTDDEVVHYTGRRFAKAQSKFLTAHGIKHVVNLANKVRVTWEAINAGIAKTSTSPPRVRVNLAALHEDD
jgi:hypothetical protein